MSMHRALLGTVLRAQNAGDSHKILELLVPDEGRVSLLVAGGRASRRRFGGMLDLFVTLRAHVDTRRAMWSLVAADAVTLRVGIRTELRRLDRATRLLECARLLTPEHAESATMHAALTAGLDALNEGRVCEAAGALPRMLAAAGLLPDLVACGRCGASDGLVEVDAHDLSGLCARCAPDRGAHGQRLVSALRFGAVDDEALAVTLEELTAGCIQRHIGRPLRTARLVSPPARPGAFLPMSAK